MASMHAANEHADLGLPIPPGTRFRFLKRLLARVLWLTNHRQIAFNHQVLELVRDLDERLRLVPAGPAIIDQVFAEQIAVVRSELALLSTAHAELQGDQLRADAYGEGLGTRLDAVVQTLGELEARLTAAQGKLEQVAQRERLASSMRELQARQSARPLDEREPVPAFTAEETYPELLAVLHEAFRGSRDEIRALLEVYTPVFAGCRGKRVLDIGPGRGELLELLVAAGIDAYGVESNPIFVEQCRERGLEVAEGDALAHLAKLPDGSLAGLAAIHVIEHWGFPQLIDLLDQGLRVLEPGGRLALETPNITNVIVGAAGFHLDPTHRQPVHPDLLRVLLIARGYVDVEIRYLMPLAPPLELPASGRSATDGVVRCVNQQFFGPRHVSAIARRPSE